MYRYLFDEDRFTDEAMAYHKRVLKCLGQMLLLILIGNILGLVFAA